VSIPPQAYFVQKIMGDSDEVTSMVTAGISPHTYEPSPQQIAVLAKANLFFTIGMPYEEGLKGKISSILKNLKIVSTRQGVELVDSEGEFDPHIWLDPARVKMQATTICQALCSQYPGHQEQYQRNLKYLQEELDSLDANIREKLAPYKGREFFIFHPSLGYFSRRYGLIQRAIEVEGKEPGAMQMNEIWEAMRKSGAKSILVQEEFSTKMAETLAKEIKGKVLRIRTLDADYPRMMTDITDKILESFKEW
jgi:zinc transport system substrate-binding protein